MVVSCARCTAGGAVSSVLRQQHHERLIVRGKRAPAWLDLRKTRAFFWYFLLNIMCWFCDGFGADWAIRPASLWTV